MQFYRVLVYKEESKTLVFKTLYKSIMKTSTDECGIVVVMGWVSPSDRVIEVKSTHDNECSFARQE